MDDTYRSQFRLPYPLYEKLKEASDIAGRSVNAELVHRLSMALDADKSPSMDLSSATEAQLLQEILRRFEPGFEIVIRRIEPASK